MSGGRSYVFSSVLSQQGRGRHLHQVLTFVDFPVQSLSLKLGGQRIRGHIEEVPSDIFRSGSRFDGARCMEDEPQRCASTVRVLRGSVTFGEKEHFVKFALGAVFVDFRSEEHTSELQSLMRISYADFCWKKKNNKRISKNR